MTQSFALTVEEAKARKRRRALDAYYTPAPLTQALLDEFPEIRGETLLDPCCGDLRMSRQIMDAGRFRSHILNDIATGGWDATRKEAWEHWKSASWCVTNIPFCHCATIPYRAIEAGIPAALLMRISFLEPVEDRQWLLRHPPDAQLVLPRTSFDGSGSTDSATCAWFVWGPVTPRIRVASRVSPRQLELSAPCPTP